MTPIHGKRTIFSQSATLPERIRIFAAVCLMSAILCACSPAPSPDQFEQYAADFTLPDAPDRLPRLEPLPEEVYRSALRMKERFPDRFGTCVNTILMKYYWWELANCGQWYSFLDPYECASPWQYNELGNNRYFLLQEFMRRYHVQPNCANDGLPSAMVDYFASSDYIPGAYLDALIERAKQRRLLH